MTSCRAGLKYFKSVGFKAGNVSFCADGSGISSPSYDGTSSKGGTLFSIINVANPNVNGDEISITNNPIGGSLNYNCTFRSDDAVMNPVTTSHAMDPSFKAIN